MTAFNRTLRLGPLPRNATVKLTVTLSVDLRDTLDRYAAFHGQEHKDPVDAATLVPHMLEAFMARDRGFLKLDRLARHSGSSAPERAS